MRLTSLMLVSDYGQLVISLITAEYLRRYVGSKVHTFPSSFSDCSFVTVNG